MPAAKTIMAGTRFGRWTALEATKSKTYLSGAKIQFRECRCDCGTMQFVSEYKLRTGHSRSCRCLQAEVTARRSLKHGFSKRGKRSRIYGIWCNMITRCANQAAPCYEDYGLRGITVCDRWLNSFENFLEDMGEPPQGLTIDRCNNDLGYFKENCAWKTPVDQARNRRNSLKLTFDGQTMTIIEWSEKLRVGYRMLKARYHAGWTVEQILTVPTRGDRTLTNIHLTSR